VCLLETTPQLLQLKKVRPSVKTTKQICRQPYSSVISWSSRSDSMGFVCVLLGENGWRMCYYCDGSYSSLINLYVKVYLDEDCDESKREIERRLANRGFVYFIGAFDSNMDIQFVKIGFSTEPRSRMKQMSTGNPFDLRLLTFFPGCQCVEKWIHKEFKETRERGEWFRPTPRMRKVFSRYESVFSWSYIDERKKLK